MLKRQYGRAGGATWEYDIELAVGLAALAWHMTPGEFEELPRKEQVKLLAILQTKHDMEFIDSVVKNG